MPNFAHIAPDGKVDAVMVATIDVIAGGQWGNPLDWVEETADTNQAGIGWEYHRDKFISPQPFPSWTFDGEKWNAPTPEPVRVVGSIPIWNESQKLWETFTP